MKGYDYSWPGAYFITICTYHRESIFGDVVNDKMILSEYGYDVGYVWYDLPNHNFNIELDRFVVMPNHIHGIIMIKDMNVGIGSEPVPTKKQHGLPEIIRQLKTFSAKRINKKRNTIGWFVWQRNYYEHIVRNENELNQIREYVINNPFKWGMDRNNPQNVNKRAFAGATGVHTSGEKLSFFKEKVIS